MVEERERACDEHVLRLGSQPDVYAESILKTCEFCVGCPLACMSRVTGADLKKRIVRIMIERGTHSLVFVGRFFWELPEFLLLQCRLCSVCSKRQKNRLDLWKRTLAISPI